MTHLQYPVLASFASLALLGACSVEYSFGGGGGGGAVFEATKVGEMVKSLGRDTIGEPSAVRCPPKMQFVPLDRYECELDIDGVTYTAIVHHRMHMSAVANLSEPAFGNEPLAKRIEDALVDSNDVDIICDGVVVTRANPVGACWTNSDSWVVVTLGPDELSFRGVEWHGWPL